MTTLDAVLFEAAVVDVALLEADFEDVLLTSPVLDVEEEDDGGVRVD